MNKKPNAVVAFTVRVILEYPKIAACLIICWWITGLLAFVNMVARGFGL